ncbi:MAG: PadR family transcriptional regulator [Candidatus Methanoperedenaceae archaeon]|nr:PadR family transcriptional regulator [Candidatus Methanoperedenaceae archaeon]
MNKQESYGNTVIIGDFNSLCAEDNNRKQQKLMEEIIKSHLEITVLSMLSEKPMSGHDIIKGVFSRYMVLLSQGTIYSLLSSLKEDGMILSMSNKGDMRIKKYICAGEKIQETQEKLIEFIDTMGYFLESIKEESNVKKLPDRFR